MSTATDHYACEVEQQGFCILPGVYSESDCKDLLNKIQCGLETGTEGQIKSSKGETYAARNLATLNPELLDVWHVPELNSLLLKVLGADFGLVRILYFDKHPDRTWSLPWHKDMTIAVKNNSLPSQQFIKPTCKAGIDHVEAPEDVLASMLTLRIHLDRVTEENGPLQVAVGSHLNGKQAGDQEQHTTETILANAGDVLAMRPLLSHASGSSAQGTRMHRRILHLEFAANEILSDDFQWNRFYRPSSTP